MKSVYPFMIFLILSSSIFAESYGIERSPDLEDRQPNNLAAAVSEIKDLIDQGHDRFDIAKRATEIADNRITNNNDPERMNILSNWFPWADTSPQEVEFGRWRDKGGADKHYDETANWAWNNRYGQCAENSALVYYLLKRAGAKDVRLFASSDHAFVVWGLGPEADPDDESNWDGDVIIPDSWQHYTLSGKDAYNNAYCSRGSRVDITPDRDPSQKPRCGFVTSPIRSPCCTMVEPCRGKEKTVCHEGYCSYCGSVNMPCCQGGSCNFNNLECRNSRCVEKTEEEITELHPDYEPAGCETEIPDDAKWIDSWTGYATKQGYEVFAVGKVGEYRQYYDKDKTQLQKQICYNLEGKEHGKYYEYFQNGQLKIDASYRNGELNGPYKRYFENGQQEIDTAYKDGEYNGILDSWNEEGVKITELNYVDGQKDGLQKYWYSNGTLRSEVVMDMGKPTGR